MTFILYHKCTITTTDTKVAKTTSRRMLYTHTDIVTLALAIGTLGRDEAVQCSSSRWPNKDRWMEMPAFCNFKIQEIEICLHEP